MRTIYFVALFSFIFFFQSEAMHMPPARSRITPTEAQINALRLALRTMQNLQNHYGTLQVVPKKTRQTHPDIPNELLPPVPSDCTFPHPYL